MQTTNMQTTTMQKLKEAKEKTLIEDENLLIEDENLLIEDENLLIEDEKLLMELSRIVYREKISKNPNVKNYNIAHLSDFYYMDQHLINAAAQQNEEEESQASTVQTAEEQTFCKYDEVCSQQKLCGDCAMDEYERTQYEEGWKNYKIDSKWQYDD